MKQKQIFKASAAAVLAFSALQPVLSVEASQTIVDVKKSSKYYAGVQFLVANKAIKGNRYYPEKSLTQESAVQMLGKVWKVKPAKAQKGVFTNVPKTSKTYPILHGMVARGILQKSKTFDGKKLVKRSELLEWSQRAFRLAPTAVQPYQDVSLSSATGKAASALNAFNFLSDIYPNAKLNPEKVVKRGEFAQWSERLSKRKLAAMTIERTTSNTVVINGLTYTFDQKWQKLFQSPAMKKANIVFTADQGKIKSIEQITIQQGGKVSAPYILDGGNVRLPRLIVKTSHVQVQNLEVKQLDVLEQAKEGVTFNHVNVTGKVQVQSSPGAKKQQLASPVIERKVNVASQNTSQRRSAVENVEIIKSYDGARVLFIDSDVEELVVTHPNTSVIVSKGATVKKMVLSANARIETNEGAVVEQLLVKRGTLYAEVAGTIQNCRVEAPVKLEVVKDAVIQNLSTAEEATIQGAGKIDQMRIEDGSKSVELHLAINQMEVLTSKPIELIGKPTINSVKIGELATSVSLKIESNIPELTIVSKNVKMDVGTGVQITSLQIPADSNVTDLITNYEEVEEQIKNPPVIIPPTGGGTTPPVVTPPTGGETPPPVVTPPSPEPDISDELDQVLDMKSDRYAVFDLTEELLNKLVESKEIEAFDPTLISEYRLYITSMGAEDFNNAQDLKRVLRKVKEMHDVVPSKDETYTITRSSANWRNMEWYRLSFEATDTVRVYFKKAGKLVKIENNTDGPDSINFGDFEKTKDGYRMWSFYHYDEIVFEKTDGSYSHLTMDKVDEKEAMVYFSKFSGKDIKLPTNLYTGEIKKINPEQKKYPFLDFDHFVYYEIPDMRGAIDVGYNDRDETLDNGIERIHAFGDDRNKGTAIMGILKSLYQNGSFQGNLLIPGYAATPFTSEIEVREEEKSKAFQFVIERYNRASLLNHIGFSLDEKNTSYPIRLETMNGQPVDMKDVSITRVVDEIGDTEEPANTSVSISNGELNVHLEKSGRDTYLIEAGGMKQKFSVDVWERFEPKALNVSKIKSKEAALEMIRRAILLWDIESLPIELFQKIGPNYVTEALNIYKGSLYNYQNEELKDLSLFVESSGRINEELFQLRSTEEKDFNSLKISVDELSQSHFYLTPEGPDNNLLLKTPEGEFERRDWLQFNIEKKDNQYVTNRNHYGIEGNGTYTIYRLDANTKQFERLTIKFGKVNKNMVEVLSIDGMPMDEFLEKNLSPSQESDEPYGEQTDDSSVDAGATEPSED